MQASHLWRNSYGSTWMLQLERAEQCWPWAPIWVCGCSVSLLPPQHQQKQWKPGLISLLNILIAAKHQFDCYFCFWKGHQLFCWSLKGRSLCFNAPSLPPSATMWGMKDSFAWEQGWGIRVAWAFGTVLHPSSVYTHSRRIDFQQHLAWGCCVLVFYNFKEVKLFLSWGKGAQEDLSCVVKYLIWGVPLDRLEQFTAGWIGVGVLEMLGFELFQVIHSSDWNRGLAIPKLRKVVVDLKAEKAL